MKKLERLIQLMHASEVQQFLKANEIPGVQQKYIELFKYLVENDGATVQDLIEKGVTTNFKSMSNYLYKKIIRTNYDSNEINIAESINSINFLLKKNFYREALGMAKKLLAKYMGQDDVYRSFQIISLVREWAVRKKDSGTLQRLVEINSELFERAEEIEVAREADFIFRLNHKSELHDFIKKNSTLKTKTAKLIYASLDAKMHNLNGEFTEAEIVSGQALASILDSYSDPWLESETNKRLYLSLMVTHIAILFRNRNPKAEKTFSDLKEYHAKFSVDFTSGYYIISCLSLRFKYSKAKALELRKEIENVISLFPEPEQITLLNLFFIACLANHSIEPMAGLFKKWNQFGGNSVSVEMSRVLSVIRILYYFELNDQFSLESELVRVQKSPKSNKELRAFSGFIQDIIHHDSQIPKPELRLRISAEFSDILSEIFPLKEWAEKQ